MKPVPPLELETGRQVKQAFFADEIKCSSDEKKNSVSFAGLKLKTIVAGAYSMPVLSSQFCKFIVDTFYGKTTVEQRQLKGVDVCASFSVFGDAVAKAMSSFLPKLAEDAGMWLSNAIAHHMTQEGKEEPSWYRAFGQKWMSDGKYNGVDKQLRFVEAVVIYYDRYAHN